MFLERGQTCTFYMSQPLRTGIEDVDAEGKPRGKDLAEKARSLSIGTGEKDWIGWCRSRSAPGSNKPLIRYGRVISTFGRKLSLLPLAREGLPLPEQRNVRTRVRRYVAAPGSGGVGRACEHSSSEGRSMSTPGSRVLDVQVH